MKCPFCHDYSLTFDWLRAQYTCHTYGAVIGCERMPRGYWQLLGYVDETL